LPNTIVITGASAGIGLAVAQRVANRAQQGELMRYRPANVDAPKAGPALIDSPSKDRVTGVAREYVTSPDVRIVKTALAARSVLAGLLTRPLVTALARRAPR
jgi:NAD(P)-dependent dehydrogenase (short-subunit alcohol dehydrogenase family)